MPRKPRIDFPGAWHHVMHRGARRAPIFKRDDHCWRFMDIVGEMVEQFEIEVHGYSLMPNHYHLLMRSKHGNLSDSMRYLNATYTQQINLIHDWDGPVFRGRFHSQQLGDESAIPYVLAYIHLNPLRSNLVTTLDTECWTSHRAYIGRDPTPIWLETDHFRALLGKKKLHDYVLGLHQGAIDWPDELSLRRGWITEKRSNDKRNKGRGVKSNRPTQLYTPDSTLGQVRRITGASTRQLRTAVKGPRANPPRRFAVWALDRYTLLTQREIGIRLSMSTGQVAKVLQRIDLRTEPLEGWKDELISALGSNR